MSHTIEKMMDIPEENIFKIQEATFDQLEEVTKKIRVNV